MEQREQLPRRDLGGGGAEMRGSGAVEVEATGAELSEVSMLIQSERVDERKAGAGLSKLGVGLGPVAKTQSARSWSSPSRPEEVAYTHSWPSQPSLVARQICAPTFDVELFHQVVVR